jgi:hypothetical protein
MSDEERPRKSWREIDKAKDRSRHRQDEKPAGERKRGPGSQKSYRAALDRLFQTGKIAQLVDQRAPGSTAEGAGETRLKMLARIKQAVGRDAITQEVDAYLQGHELPDDMEILEKALEHRRVALRLEAMQRLERLLDREQPRRRRAMVAQLKLIRDLGDDPELVELATRLIPRLELS